MNLTVSTELTSMTCPHCAGIFALSQAFLDEARRKGNFAQVWVCPYCKEKRGYGKSEHEIEKAKLEAQIAQLERSKKWAEERKDYAEKEAAHFRKSRDGMKGVLAKERKRVGNGVCPCCNRTFGNLQRHMATKHPGHAAAIPLGGGGAEHGGDETATKQSGAGSQNDELRGGAPEATELP